MFSIKKRKRKDVEGEVAKIKESIKGNEKKKREQEGSESKSQTQPLMGGSLMGLFGNTGIEVGGKNFSFGSFGFFDNKRDAEEVIARENFVIQRETGKLEIGVSNISAIEIKAEHRNILLQFIAEIDEKMGDQIKPHQFSDIDASDGMYKVSINIPRGKTPTMYLDEIKKIMGGESNKPFNFNG
jgi:hypothetical protein